MGVPPPVAGAEAVWREETLKPAWREKVKAVHPDHAGDSEDAGRRTRTMQQVNADYTLLKTLRVIAPAPIDVSWPSGRMVWPTEFWVAVTHMVTSIEDGVHINVTVSPRRDQG